MSRIAGWHRAARLLSLAALVAGIGAGAYTYYGPTGMRCSITTSVGGSSGPPPPASVREECQATRIADSDRSGRALPYLAIWSLAPGLAPVGSFGPQPLAVTLASIAFVIELLSIIGAMSVGFLFFVIVFPLTGLALLAAVMPRRLVR